jgi:aminopeptidase
MSIRFTPEGDLMSDPRIQKLASVLVHYSLDVKPEQKMIISSNPLAEELILAVYREAIQAGAFPSLLIDFPRSREIYYKHASDRQLEFVPPIQKLVYETYDHYLSIGAEENTRALSGIDPSRRALRSKATSGLFKTMMGRAAKGELHWCYTEFPTFASAQEADMSLSDYEDFVFTAGKMNSEDPVAEWKAFGAQMTHLSGWLKGRDQVVLKGKDIDLSLSIKDRFFIVCDGKENFPDGEIFTGPVESTVNGWVRFAYPAIFEGREVTDIELWFENGRVVKEKAAKGQELLTSLLDTDAGSRYLGELGIGTNYSIPRFTKSMLFDEKLGGTFHLAVGASLPESGGLNESGLHWDMLCDMAESEVRVDGELFYQNGKPVV